MDFKDIIGQLTNENISLHNKIEVIQKNSFDERLVLLEEEIRAKDLKIKKLYEDLINKLQELKKVTQQNSILKKEEECQIADFTVRIKEKEKEIESLKNFIPHDEEIIISEKEIINLKNTIKQLEINLEEQKNIQKNNIQNLQKERDEIIEKNKKSIEDLESNIKGKESQVNELILEKNDLNNKIKEFNEKLFSEENEKKDIELKNKLLIEELNTLKKINEEKTIQLTNQINELKNNIEIKKKKLKNYKMKMKLKLKKLEK
ncbi:hypothetical protein ENU1_047420 [Entamoeba nuttalli P19]|uniref:Uncharacterized protein n=1 Tax=Entamoeba nuttalli (strain P19) TaxID=1076696 RepID=K2HFV1_ENTNP|nr:hypothetical protein ENU1_047420 [Entamoeba nuttalli P19]EKE41689.1 hypothetical protein ENU1_047420 [Entamoeba nuttalli P19]|eukprot:XP_008855977.1 hypothetical protein ENU1_047420 [Entamoeba nuttalli P19]